MQPWLSGRLRERGRTARHARRRRCCTPASSAPGVYGGYFGAAQGVLLIAVMGLLLDEHLQRINAAKNVLAGLVNAVAAVIFIVVDRRRVGRRGPDRRRLRSSAVRSARRSVDGCPQPSCAALVVVVGVVAIVADPHRTESAVTGDRVRAVVDHAGRPTAGGLRRT